MTIFNMQKGVNVSGRPLSAYAVVGIPAMHRAGWAPAAAAQHKRRPAEAIAESVKWGTT